MIASRCTSLTNRQPRWLAFLNAEHDMLERLPCDFVNMPPLAASLAPSLKQRGMTMSRVSRCRRDVHRFQHEGPGHRRLHAGAGWRCGVRSLSVLNIEEEIRIPRRGQAMQAQAP